MAIAGAIGWRSRPPIREATFAQETPRPVAAP
jgi:hypothetical protein